ncbi:MULTISPECIES: helix-turn-helix transcriptional regulator [unclassified Methylobacterium]|uniref:helix-turn-helix domain-containing protein n=1 Tax=unclassified Methylobacterium TaxID=2615210 RepID=UPI001FF06B4A|nr:MULTISPECIES: helix-turn-helix transcriptional regulator [unclassified Methylobacterium]
MLTGEQLRAARAMLKMEQGELAELSGVSAETIKRLERLDGPLSANSMTLDGLQRALEGEGAMFLPENGGLPGIRLRRDPPANIRTRKRRGDGAGVRLTDRESTKPDEGLRPDQLTSENDGGAEG